MGIRIENSTYRNCSNNSSGTPAPVSPPDQQDIKACFQGHVLTHGAANTPSGPGADMHRYASYKVCYFVIHCPFILFIFHDRFDTENGPLWRVQIVTRATFEAASSGLGFGPEMEAIIEDDSDVDTRWRYYLRYLQVRKSISLWFFNHLSY